jgi:uncharacterized protein (TIGR00288 family)
MVSNGGANAERQVAVLIDLENVGLSSIQWLFDQISDIGRITIKRAYADWSAARNAREQVLQLGIEPIHLFHMTGSGKNSSDIRLVIDAIDLLYQSPIDTFVIASSDSDFVPLVSKLRAGGKSVIGAGRKATASRALVISCDRYFYLDQESRTRQQHPVEKKEQSDTLLLRAMTAAMDEEGSVVGSKLRQTLQRLDPSFDFRALNHSTFTKYLEASPDVKVIRPSGPGDVNVELADLSPSPVSPVMTEPSDPEVWEPKIDAAWSQRAPNPGDPIPGPSAAASAAAALGVLKLSASHYKTLQKLLDASEKLGSKWHRDRNSIIRQ